MPSVVRKKSLCNASLDISFADAGRIVLQYWRPPHNNHDIIYELFASGLVRFTFIPRFLLSEAFHGDSWNCPKYGARNIYDCTHHFELSSRLCVIYVSMQDDPDRPLSIIASLGIS